MKKYAYQSPENFRPNQNLSFSVREAAAKPFMGITAFLRNNEPWLVIGFDGKNHILESRDGNTVKINTPFNWVEATDKSRLVAAIRSEGSSIPGTPHYSFDEKDWYIRIEDDIYDPEDFLEEIEKTAEAYDAEVEKLLGEDPESSRLHPSFEEERWKGVNIEPDTCENCLTPLNPAVEGIFTCKNCGHQWPVSIAHDHPEDDLSFTAHNTQKKDDRKKEKVEPIVCPECGSHTTGNRLADIAVNPDGTAKGKVHCKACGHIWAPKGLKLNPKMTYEVDDEGKGKYNPGPDDPKKVPPCKCGYDWGSHHKFQIGDKTCPKCGREYGGTDKEQDAGAPGETWKNDKRSAIKTAARCPQCGKHFSEPEDEQGDHDCPYCGYGHDEEENYHSSSFENATQDSMSGHDTGAPIEDDVTQYRHTDILNGESNNTAPLSPLATNSEVVEEIMDRINNEEFRPVASIKEARKAFTPAEQKSLIDESMGATARNAHKLDLNNTHYATRVRDDDPYSWLW